MSKITTTVFKNFLVMLLLGVALYFALTTKVVIKITDKQGVTVEQVFHKGQWSEKTTTETLSEND